MSRSGINITSPLLTQRALLERVNSISSLNEILDQANIVEDVETRRSLLKKDIFLERNSQLSEEFFEQIKALIDLNNLVILNTKLEVEGFFKEINEKIDSKKKAIISLNNVIRKKLNQLNFLSYKEPSVILLEEFINLANIDTTRDILNIDTSAELATLPIEKRETVRVENCFISNLSNGVAGDYVTGENKSIFNIFNGQPDSHFSYFRKDDGPLVLVITCDLGRVNVINKTSIARTSISGSSGFVIKDIVYSSGATNISIKDLISIKNQSLKINSFSENEILPIYHLPVEAERVSFHFESSEYSTTDNGRKVFTLSIKEIALEALTYKATGNFVSTRQNIDEGFYACSFKDVTHPIEKASFTTKHLISTDNRRKFDELEIGEDFALDGEAKSIIYKYEVNRVDSALSNSEYLKSKKYYPEIASETKSYQTGNNTYVIKNYNPETLRVYQSNIAYAGDEVKYYTEMPGSITEGKVTLDKFIKQNLSKLKFKFAVNETKLYLKDAVGETNSYNIDSEFIYLNPSLNGEKVKFAYEPEYSFILNPEGYYLQVNTSDFDITKIKVKHREIKQVRGKTLTGQNENYLEKEIIKNTFKLYKLDGELEGYDTANLDHLNGVFKEESVLRQTVDYDYYELGEEISSLIWYEESNARGLFFGNSFPVKRKEVRYNDPVARYNHATGLVEYVINNNLKKITLEDENIIVNSVRVNPAIFTSSKFEEVSYINGEEEFLNLASISEVVPPIEKDENGDIYFSLLKTPATPVEVFINNNFYRLATVTGNICKIRLRASEDISLDYIVKYKYSNPGEADTNYYSVDHKEGVVYFKNNISTSSSVLLTYGIFEGVVSYEQAFDLTEKIIRNESTGVIQLNLDAREMYNRNNEIIFTWFRNKSSVIVENLEKYYSPIIYSTRVELK